MQDVFSLRILEILCSGLGVTFKVSAITFVLSIILGTLIALIRTFGHGPLKLLSTAYIDFLRNTPILIWIMAIRFLLPVSPNTSCDVSFTLFTTPITSEVVRGGIRGISRGQYEAAWSHSFNRTNLV